MHFNEENYIICKYVISYIINKEITLASLHVMDYLEKQRELEDWAESLKQIRGKVMVSCLGVKEEEMQSSG